MFKIISIVEAIIIKYYMYIYSIQDKSGTGRLTSMHGRGFVSNAEPGG